MKSIVSMRGYQQFFQSCLENNKVIWMRLDHPCALIHVLDRAVKIYFRPCLLLHAIRSPPAILFPPMHTGAVHAKRRMHRQSPACAPALQQTEKQNVLSQRVQAGGQIHSDCWGRAEIKYHLSSTSRVAGRLWGTDKARERGPWLVSAVGAVWGLGQIQKSCEADGGCQSLLRPSPYFYDKGQVKSRNT